MNRQRALQRKMLGGSGWEGAAMAREAGMWYQECYSSVQLSWAKIFGEAQWMDRGCWDRKFCPWQQDMSGDRRLGMTRSLGCDKRGFWHDEILSQTSKGWFRFYTVPLLTRFFKVLNSARGPATYTLSSNRAPLLAGASSSSKVLEPRSLIWFCGLLMAPVVVAARSCHSRVPILAAEDCFSYLSPFSIRRSLETSEIPLLKIALYEYTGNKIEHTFAAWITVQAEVRFANPSPLWTTFLKQG
jgi:hypothetical protein